MAIDWNYVAWRFSCVGGKQLTLPSFSLDNLLLMMYL